MLIKSKTGYFPCRCRRRGCGCRVTLSKHPDDYAREKICPRCKKGKLRLDKARQTNVEKDSCRGPLCRCDAVHFYHRSMSVPDCKWLKLQQPAEVLQPYGEPPF